MINWEEIISAQSEGELKQAKLWLFRENMRLENERRELEQVKDSFKKERLQFRNEMNVLNRKSVLERKRLKEENQFFDKKMDILKAGFAQLEADRKQLAQDKKIFLEEKSRGGQYDGSKQQVPMEDIAQALFRSVNNPLALRKRYRDLVKIYHPDNLFGDEELIQLINREFFRRKREE
ncbi:MAG: hypothetical protein NC081_02295 [Roseburia sp.]|nr:hypothetical protein [Roseburia sp.]